MERDSLLLTAIGGQEPDSPALAVIGGLLLLGLFILAVIFMVTRGWKLLKRWLA